MSRQVGHWQLHRRLSHRLRTELQRVIDVSVNSTLNVEALNSMHLVFLERERAKKDDVARVQLDKHSPASLILISEE